MSEKQKRSGKYGKSGGSPLIIRGPKPGAQEKRAEESVKESIGSSNDRIEALSSQSLGDSRVYSNNRRDSSNNAPVGIDSGAVSASDPVSESNKPNGIGLKSGGDRDEPRSTSQREAGGEQGGDLTPTLNDLHGLMQLVQEALNDQRTRQWRNPHYRSPKISPLIDQLREKLVTTNSILLPPLIQAQLGQVLSPLREEAEAVGDIYFDLAMKDLNQGRVDRLDKLLWLSGINQIRLKMAQEEMFADVNKYIKENYASDPTDPQSATFFLPAENESKLAETWKRMHELMDAGLAMIRETIQFKVAGEKHDLVIVTIASLPMDTPPTSILDIGK